MAAGRSPHYCSAADPPYDMAKEKKKGGCVSLLFKVVVAFALISAAIGVFMSSSDQAGSEGAGAGKRQAENATVATVPGATAPEELTVTMIAADRALWPKALTLKEPATFAAAEGRGSATVPAGQTAELVAVSGDGMVELVRGNLRGKVPAEKTDLIPAATDIRKKTAELTAAADAQRAAEDAKPRPNPEEANAFYGLTERDLISRMGQPLRVRSGNSPDGAFKILEYSDTKGKETFFAIFANDGRVDNGSLRGVPFSKEAAERQKSEARIGKAPASSSRDGAVYVVKRYLEQKVKDPKSLEFIEWSPVALLKLPDGEAWGVRVKYRAKNSFGGYVVETGLVAIRNDQIVNFATGQ